MVTSTDASGGSVLGVGLTQGTTTGFMSMLDSSDREHLSSAMRLQIQSIDEALARFETGSATLHASAEPNEISLELRARYFRLFFTITRDEERIEWGLATHRDSMTEGILVSGTIPPHTPEAALSLVLLQRRSSFLIGRSEGQENISGLTITTR